MGPSPLPWFGTPLLHPSILIPPPWLSGRRGLEVDNFELSKNYPASALCPLLLDGAMEKVFYRIFVLLKSFGFLDVTSEKWCSELIIKGGSLSLKTSRINVVAWYLLGDSPHICHTFIFFCRMTGSMSSTQMQI